jgi:outer membrane lipoprotein carrier protein
LLPATAILTVIGGAVLSVLLAQEPVYSPPPPMDPELAAAIQRFDGAQDKIERISAHFKEVKSIALLKDPVVQSGEFYHTKPDKFLWEYKTPTEKLLVLDAKGIIAYYPHEKRAEEIKTRFGKRIVKYLGLGSVLEDLTGEYEMALSHDNQIPGTDLLVLQPKGKRIQKRLAEIRIWLDREINQPRALEYIEADGDRTHLDFDQITINPDISLSKYEIKLPEGVTVTNTLSGFFGGGSSSR